MTVNGLQKDRTLDLRENLLAGDTPQWIASLYGIAQSGIADFGIPVIEPMVGYTGCWADYRVYPSRAHRNCIYARGEENLNRRFNDRVIPHFIDAAEYGFSAETGSYLLYLGRNAADKGVDFARECAERCGMELKCRHSGVAGKAKAELLAGARAVLMPTLYPEPFGYVAAEAMISGTPVIATDWGAFPEIITGNVTGWCCSSMDDFCRAVKAAETLDRKRIRREAMKRFTQAAVTEPYREFLGNAWMKHQTPGY